MNLKKYNLIGYKGKQVRDNLHSFDLVNCFWEFYKKPRNGEVYNIGGGRYSNCSIIEALNLVEELTKINVKRKILKVQELVTIFGIFPIFLSLKNIIQNGNKNITQKNYRGTN